MLPSRIHLVSCVVAMLLALMIVADGDEGKDGGLDEAVGFVVAFLSLNLIEIQWNGGLAE